MKQPTTTRVQISNLQFAMMIIATTAAFGHFVYVHLAILYAGRDGWISLLLAAILGAGVLYLQMKFSTTQPGVSLVAISKNVFGKWTGSLITVVFILFFLFVVAVTMKTVTDFMGIVYPTTPPAVFVVAVLCVATWASYRGLEVIARTIQITLPVLILLGITASLLSAKDKNVELILPVLNNGWGPVLQGATVFTAMFSELIVFSMFASDVKDAKKLPRTALWLIGILTVMFVAPVMGPVMMFGEHLAQTLAFPTYTEIQYIHFSNLIERFDIIGVLLWTIGSFFRVSVFLFAACKAMSQLFNAGEDSFVIPTAILACGLTFSVINSSREEVYDLLGREYLWIVIGIGVGLPLATFMMYFVRKRFGQGGSRQPEK